MDRRQADWRMTERSDPQDRQMDKTTYELGPLLAEIRDGFRGMRAIRVSLSASKRESRRAARGARKSLERDLASYTSARDLNDLEAILDRYSDEETAAIRRILASRRAA
jgi:hypothetical protein